MTAPSPPATAQKRQFALGFLAFLLMGIIQAGYGPTYSNLAREYHQSISAVGIISSLHFLGGAAGTLLLGVLLLRLSLRSALALAAGALLLGVLGVAFAPLWGLVLASALVGGLGFGMLSAGFNTAFAQMGAGPSSLVNGLFGVGSVISPLLVALLATHSHRPPFVLMSVLAALLALGVRMWWPRNEPTDTTPTHKTEASAARTPVPAVSWPIFLLFAAAFFVYVGMEASIGNWATVHLTRLHHPDPAFMTSLYWAALTAGRFGFAIIGSRVGAYPVLAVGAGGALLAGLLLTGSLAPAALIVAGLCFAPMFPTLLAWFTSVLPPRQAPYVLTVGMLGGSLLPALIGWMLPRLGTLTLPLGVLLFAGLLLTLLSLLSWRLSPRANRLTST
ncbi:MFS transporter [Deinococcus sp. KNUC1210]|uniref:MFS transporter n=1 Tax=Deinococcus sp. KNUC1210 TaxID=2917691 RepID=UPI001EEFA001|nr:MFS transporter [Deinococcus sp. KNUC1210]ULH16761.1 MFS transporter [Deinococcus sp. KNUC1210]